MFNVITIMSEQPGNILHVGKVMGEEPTSQGEAVVERVGDKFARRRDLKRRSVVLRVGNDQVFSGLPATVKDKPPFLEDVSYSVVGKFMMETMDGQ